MNILKKALILMVPVMFLVGCASAPTGSSDDSQGGADSGAESSMFGDGDNSGSGMDDGMGMDDGGMAETMGLSDDSNISVEAFSLDDTDPSNLLNVRVIYFDFDRSKVKPEFNDVITAHATYLANNPGAMVKLEGHADERGSREYNIGLGERRGNSVARHLGLQGASRNQLEVVSFGEERPIAIGHDDAAWSLNRRVEIIYLKQR